MTNRIALLLVATALAACGRETRLEKKKQEDIEKLVEEVPMGANVLPKSHEFPEGRSGDIRALFDAGILRYTVGTVQGDSVSTTVVDPQPVFIGDHRFVVTAPPNVHNAINAILKSMDKRKDRSISFELTVWLVEANEAVKTSVSPELGDLLLLLESLPGYGPRNYTLYDRVSARTLEGTPSHLLGRAVRTETTLTDHSDGVEIQMSLDLLPTDASPRLQSTLQVPLGQAVVLGDTTMEKPDKTKSVLLYVIRVRRLDAPKS